MLTCAAVMPAGPVLVPVVAQGASGELDACRAAIDSALARLVAHCPDVIVVVGSGRRTARHDTGAVGSLGSVGVDLEVALGGAATDSAPPATMPLALTIGAWALGRAPSWREPSGRASVGLSVRGFEIAGAAEPAACMGAGMGLAQEASRVALLVVADGTARRGPKAPGYTDDRSAGFDRQWVDALGEGDVHALESLDPALADRLMMDGRAALQVLAGAAKGRYWLGEVLYDGDPYGVQYAVAFWQPGGD